MLAHQNGWDEIALVIGPLLIIGWILVTLKVRAERQRDERMSNDSGGADALDVSAD